MTISPRVKELIERVRQFVPETADLPEEALAEMVAESVKARSPNPAAGGDDLTKMSRLDLRRKGEQLIEAGMWDEARKHFSIALEKSKREEDSAGQCKCLIALGRLSARR
ncbi:MAG: hypothetical protein GY859_43480, partial [Desulfobacterales bacterium]|nr:hypothetical protein [Desulfobacterales bacterium]